MTATCAWRHVACRVGRRVVTGSTLTASLTHLLRPCVPGSRSQYLCDDHLLRDTTVGRCRNPKCGGVMERVDGVDSDCVCTACHSRSCATCLMPAHAPAACAAMARWVKRVRAHTRVVAAAIRPHAGHAPTADCLLGATPTADCLLGCLTPRQRRWPCCESTGRVC